MKYKDLGDAKAACTTHSSRFFPYSSPTEKIQLPVFSNTSPSRSFLAKSAHHGPRCVLELLFTSNQSGLTK